MTIKKNIHEILKQYWGFSSFRPMQEEIILSVLGGKDTLALLPTGGGKSICFQVPALAVDGLCIVISPLIALMKDQIDHLRARGIKAAAIYSGQSLHDIDLIINNALYDKEYKFLYVSPERLKNDTFVTNLVKMPVSLIAVDEAHCISQWGYDFRPSYLEIAVIRKYFPSVPVLALTATATPEVVKDIQSKLLFKQENLFQKSFHRENLVYYVVKEEDKQGRLLRIVNRYNGTGIVYVRNRRRTQDIAAFLRQQQVSADFFHAGLDSRTRDRKQNEWMTDKTRVIVSTNAFGMGIDKPDVRFVVHLDIPDNIESYFQEAGRGGRDEKPSVAILLYDENDIRELKRNFEQSFPPLSVIKEIYDTICHYYKLSYRQGKYESFPFNMEELSKVCRQKPIIVLNSLLFMEKAGLLLLSDSVQNPSTLQFICKVNELSSFQEHFPQYQPFIQLLLRSYGGLFSNYIKINEKEIARRAEISEDKVVQFLEKLTQKQLLNYIPRKTEPQLQFLEDRIKSQYLYFDEAIYKTRKEVAKKRLEAMLHYIECNTQCRSILLLNYFGEKSTRSCKQCDFCVRTQKEKVGKSEFDEISEKAKKLLSDTHSLKTITETLSESYPEEKVIKVIRWLIDQGKISFS